MNLIDSPTRSTPPDNSDKTAAMNNVITHEQAPDVQWGDNGLTGASLPRGSSLQGSTSNSYPGASLADVHQGFNTFDGRMQPKGTTDGNREGDDDVYAPTQAPGGFAGRASGWER